MGFISMLFALPFMAGITVISICLFFLTMFLISTTLTIATILGEFGKKNNQKAKIVISIILYIISIGFIVTFVITYYETIKFMVTLFLLMLVLFIIFVERMIFWGIYYLKNKDDYSKKKFKISLIESLTECAVFVAMLLILLIKNLL